MDRMLSALSRQMSHALRHEPWLYELEIDNEGWVPVSQLLAGLKNRSIEYHDLTQEQIVQCIEMFDKRRFELLNGRIRALYGHSFPGRLNKGLAEPPAILNHGTTHAVLRLIRTGGLRPMGRQYVHLSVDRDTALKVAKRKRGESVILEIAALAAWKDGVRFYQGNNAVWLSDHVPATYICFESST